MTVFSSSKCKIKKPGITFYGCQFTKTDIKLDPVKMYGFLDMQAPINIMTLQSFLVVCDFLQGFILHIPHHTSHPDSTLEKQNSLHQDETINRRFQTIKTLPFMAISRPLGYYDLKKIIIQEGVSLKVLRLYMFQEGYQVAIASELHWHWYEVC